MPKYSVIAPTKEISTVDFMLVFRNTLHEQKFQRYYCIESKARTGLQGQTAGYNLKTQSLG